MFSRTTNELLYVPFNSDYAIDSKIKTMLTIDEFFKFCYVEPLKREVLENEINQEIDYEDDLNRFFRWIETNDHAIYAIKGDSGTGKSTFLHYLQYKDQKSTSLRWEIVDIQKANALITFMGMDIEVPNFNQLHGKIMSALITNILSLLFSNLKPKNNVHVQEVIDNLKRVHSNYKKTASIFSEDILQQVFQTSDIWKYIENNQQISGSEILQYARELKEVIRSIFSKDSALRQLYLALLIYTTLLSTQTDIKKHIIAFDNLERFIGADEIQNCQIDLFISRLRNCFDSFNGNDETFPNKIQGVILIRNTTARMIHTPLHLVDHPGHEMEISGWFPIEKIIDNKLKWYHSHHIQITSEKYIRYILGEKSFDGSSRISTQRRLEFLFNRNNRLVLEFLSRTIIGADSKALICFEKYADRGTESCRSASRQIMMRLVLDELKKDGFWHNIMVEGGHDNSFRSGYARKILTILHNYRLEGHHGYMCFDDLIRVLDDGDLTHHINTEPVDNYFDSNAKSRRLIISQILYHMNYYNVRTRNWLQFIDIQLRSDELCVRVENAEDLFHLIDNNHKQIGVRITVAGITYLRYFVHTFEFFSCRLSGEKTLPLPCTVPTLQEIQENQIDDLLCLKIIRRVSTDMNACIRIMEERASDSIDIPFKKKSNFSPVHHSDRIRIAYQNYLNNFIQLIEGEFIGIELSENDLEKYNQLINDLKAATQFVK